VRSAGVAGLVLAALLAVSGAAGAPRRTVAASRCCFAVQVDTVGEVKIEYPSGNYPPYFFVGSYTFKWHSSHVSLMSYDKNLDNVVNLAKPILEFDVSEVADIQKPDFSVKVNPGEPTPRTKVVCDLNNGTSGGYKSSEGFIVGIVHAVSGARVLKTTLGKGLGPHCGVVGRPAEYSDPINNAFYAEEKAPSRDNLDFGTVFSRTCIHNFKQITSRHPTPYTASGYSETRMTFTYFPPDRLTRDKKKLRSMIGKQSAVPTNFQKSPGKPGTSSCS